MNRNQKDENLDKGQKNPLDGRWNTIFFRKIGSDGRTGGKNPRSKILKNIDSDG